MNTFHILQFPNLSSPPFSISPPFPSSSKPLNNFALSVAPRYFCFSYSEFNPSLKTHLISPKTLATASMASKKKHSEGIALLSMYNDEEDDEMDDAEEEDDGGMRMEEDVAGDASFAAEEDSVDRTVSVVDSVNEVVTVSESSTFSEKIKIRVGSSPQLEQPRIGRKGALTIVDYGHDEVAMSPEAEVLLELNSKLP